MEKKLMRSALTKEACHHDILELKAQHRAELEKRQRNEWKAQQQKLDELNNAKKSIVMKDKELAQLTERLHSKEEVCSKLEDEIKRLKNAESWRSISPSSSATDISSTQITKRERDMAMRNSELSFRIRKLEEGNTLLKEQKQSMGEKLSATRNEIIPLRSRNEKLQLHNNELNATLRSKEKKLNQLSQENTLLKEEKQAMGAKLTTEIVPLQEHNKKLQLRNNELNAIIRSREKKLKQLSQELVNVKTDYQELQEDYEKQKKSLHQQVHHVSELETEKQKLALKNRKLKESYDELSSYTKQVEENSNRLQELTHPFTPPTSPTSSTSEDEHLSLSSSSSQTQELMSQLEFDRDEKQAKYDEIKAKYDEMKNEYKKLRDTYKTLKTEHDKQIKQHSLHTLGLEKEVMQLRSTRNENMLDQDRNRLTLHAQERKIADQGLRIQELEYFIIQHEKDIAQNEAKKNDEFSRALKSVVEFGTPTATSSQDIPALFPVDRVPEERTTGSSLESQGGDEPFITRDHKLISGTTFKATQTVECDMHLVENLHSHSDKVGTPPEGLHDRKDHIVELVSSSSAEPKEPEDKLKNAEDKIELKDQKIRSLERLLCEEQSQRQELYDSLKEMKQKSNERETEKDNIIRELNLKLQNLMEQPQGQVQHISHEEMEQKLDENKSCEMQALEKDELIRGLNSKQKSLEKLLSEEQLQNQGLHTSLGELKQKLSKKEKLYEMQALEKDHIIGELNSKQKRLEKLLSDEQLQNQGLHTSLGELKQKLSKKEKLYEMQALEKDHIIGELNSKQKKLAEEKLQSQASSGELSKKEKLYEMQALEKDHIIGELNSKQKSLEKLLSEEQLQNQGLHTSLGELSKKEKLYKMQALEKDDNIRELNSKIRSLEKMLFEEQSQGQEELKQKMEPHQMQASEKDDNISELKLKVRKLEELLSEKQSLHQMLQIESEKRNKKEGLQALGKDDIIRELNLKIKRLEKLEESQGQVLQIEMEHRLSDKEKFLEMQALEKDDIIKELNLKIVEMQNSMFDESVAVNLATEIGRTLVQMESNDFGQSHSHRLNLLRKQLEKFFEVVLSRNYQMPVCHQQTKHKPPELEYTDFERELYQKNSSRVFVAVMDYDPHSLCKTGQPQLELPLQSGCIVTVTGDMHEDGYYTASYHNQTGLVPANFIQEIELRDKKLIKRITNTKKLSLPHEWRIEEQRILSHEDCLDAVSHKTATKDSQLTGMALKSDTSQLKAEHIHDNIDVPSKLFIGLYDYHPSSLSRTNPEFELSFKEGSLLKIFGEKMSDGYYIGELNGQRGLVPANFVADTTTITKDNCSLLPITSKIMVGAFDYVPERDSPNVNHEQELEFKAGDEIVIYGSMHSDGFFCGQRHEKFGLVPSNFIKEKY